MNTEITFIKLTPKKVLIIELYKLIHKVQSADGLYHFYKICNRRTIKDIREEIQRIHFERDEDEEEERVRSLCECGECTIHLRCQNICNYSDSSDDEIDL